MRIKSVQARWVQIPIEAARQHVSDFGRLRTFDAAILRIETECGLVGWGEGKNAAGSAGDYAALVHLLNREFGPRLIGRDASQITQIWEDLYIGGTLTFLSNSEGQVSLEGTVSAVFVAEEDEVRTGDPIVEVTLTPAW